VTISIEMTARIRAPKFMDEEKLKIKYTLTTYHLLIADMLEMNGKMQKENE
jgi:hypothetical protein